MKRFILAAAMLVVATVAPAMAYGHYYVIEHYRDGSARIAGGPYDSYSDCTSDVSAYYDGEHLFTCEMR